MSVEKYGWAIQKNLIFIKTNQDSTFSHTRENSKMFSITSKYFSFFNNKPPASWVVHITRDFLTCYSCSYCNFMFWNTNFYNPMRSSISTKILLRRGTIGLKGHNVMRKRNIAFCSFMRLWGKANDLETLSSGSTKPVKDLEINHLFKNWRKVRQNSNTNWNFVENLDLIFFYNFFVTNLLWVIIKKLMITLIFE